MLKGARLVVILLFLAGFGMILLFMPKDFSKAMANEFSPDKVEEVQVWVKQDGQEYTAAIVQGEQSYVDLITLLQEPTYSKTHSDEEGEASYMVSLQFTGEGHLWSYDFSGDGSDQVSLGAAINQKTYQVSGGEETKEAILDYLLTLAETA